jgi:hypothetical protein
MSKDEFQQLWKAYEEKLQRSIKINAQLLEALRSRTVRTAFNWQIVFKIMMIVLGIAWNVVIANLLWEFHSEPAFVIAAVMVLAFTGFSIGGYMLQVILLLQINMSNSILNTQKQLAHLEALIIQTLRVPFLQTPAYTFFFISRHLVATATPGFWIIQGSITGASIFLSVWVYRHITVLNASRKGWVRLLADNEGGKTITRAREFMREIESYKQEDLTKIN